MTFKEKKSDLENINLLQITFQKVKKKNQNI